MHNSYETVSIPKGYKILKKVTSVDAFTAFNDILCSKKQFRYTCADVNSKENTVELTRHFVVCPICSQLTPAYRHFIHRFKPVRKFSRNEADIWSRETMSLFQCEDKTKINLYKPIVENDAFRCMHCGADSKASEQQLQVGLIEERHRLTVTYPINNIGDIVRINWTKKSLSIEELPLYESVTFNFRKGTTYLMLKTFTGTLLAARDITRGVEDLDFTSPVIDLLSDNVIVKRKLKKLFSTYWGKSLPFKEYELDIFKLGLATAFIGYEDRAFFSYIPCDSQTSLIEKSYKKIARKLHIYDNIVSIYESSSLPRIKSVKRRFFSNPVLFFYTEELERLWQCTGREPNFFCSFLDSEQAFSVLSFLHDFPNSLELYEAVSKAGVLLQFKDALFDYPKEVNEYALYYSSLNPRKKTEALAKLKKTSCKRMRFADRASEYFLSIPDRKMINSIPTQLMEGYVFSSLKTINDYVIAGQDLHNCLGATEFETPIVGVMKKGRYVAAIQVDVNEKIILQAYLERNRDIDTDENIFSAFKKWCRKNGYDYDEDGVYNF